MGGITGRGLRLLRKAAGYLLVQHACDQCLVGDALLHCLDRVSPRSMEDQAYVAPAILDGRSQRRFQRDAWRQNSLRHH